MLANVWRREINTIVREKVHICRWCDGIPRKFMVVIQILKTRKKFNKEVGYKINMQKHISI